MDLNVDEPLFFRLTFDSLLRRTLQVLQRGAPLFFGLSIVMMLPGLAFHYFVGRSLEIPGDSLGVVGLVFLGQFGLTSLTTGALVYSTFRLLRGQSIPPISRSLSLAAASLLSLFIASLLSVFLIGLAAIFCLLPAFVVWSGVAIVAPVIMVEKAGPILALNRSWELSQGYRWPIFGMLFLIGLANFGVSFVVGLVLNATGFQGVMSAGLDEFIGNVINTALTACMAAVAYHDLRLMKDELAEDDLLAVFE